MSPTLLGNATIYPQTNTQLFANDVYGVLPLESVFVGGEFSFSVYCDSSYAVASFGIKLVVGPPLVIVKSHVDGQSWVHVAVNHSSSEWVASATLTDPESAPQGVVKKAKLVTFDVKVKEMAVADTNATVTAEVCIYMYMILLLSESKEINSYFQINVNWFCSATRFYLTFFSTSLAASRNRHCRLGNWKRSAWNRTKFFLALRTSVNKIRKSTEKMIKKMRAVQHLP